MKCRAALCLRERILLAVCRLAESGRGSYLQDFPQVRHRHRHAGCILSRWQHSPAASGLTKSRDREMIAPIKKPCASCPWIKDRTASDIPNFDLEMAERLVNTSPCERGFGPDFGAPLFACHQSKENAEFACAGWLATVGARHPLVRYYYASGEITAEQLSPQEGWPELHSTYAEVLQKLRET